MLDSHSLTQSMLCPNGNPLTPILHLRNQSPVIFCGHGSAITAIHFTPCSYTIWLHRKCALRVQIPHNPCLWIASTQTHMAPIVPGNMWINLSHPQAPEELKAKWPRPLGSGYVSAWLGGLRRSSRSPQVVVTRKTSRCLKSQGVSYKETSSTMLRLHGCLRYRVAVKKTSVAKVGSRFISALWVRDLWYE